MQKLIWEAEFKIEPSLNKSEEIEGFFFNVNNSETLVKRTYETSSHNEKHPESLDGNEYAEQTLARLDIKKIKELMLKRMVYHEIFSPIMITLQAPPYLTNRDILEKNGAVFGRQISFSCSIKYSILDVDSSISASESFWESGYKGNALNRQEDVLRIADWIERSENEIDPIKSFILVWIGFNGLYGIVASVHGKTNLNDAAKFEFIIKTLINETQAKKIVKDNMSQINKLSTNDFTSESGSTNWSLKLKNAINNNYSGIKVLLLATRCVYSVRKQIFHEAPETINVKDLSMISKAVIMPIVSKCLKAFITH